MLIGEIETATGERRAAADRLAAAEADLAGPSGSPSPSGRCHGCSRPPRRLPVQAAASFTVLLRQNGDEGLSPPSGKHGASWRTKSQIQALDRTRPVLPMRPGIPERQTHDYIRHGTTTLFAALEVAAGTVTDACYPRHRHGEFRAS